MPTKTKPPVVYGDDLPITDYQVKEIMRNCAYQVETKNEWVQWVTGDTNRTSLKSLTQAQAVKILRQQTGAEAQPKNTRFGMFNVRNPKHKLIMSLVRQLQWTKSHPRHGEVADMDGRFANWLQSDKSPVKKPLVDQDAIEIEKIIAALYGIIRSTYKK